MTGVDKNWEQIGFALIVLAVAFIVGRVIRFIIGRFFKRNAVKLKVDPTRYNFFKNAVDFITFLIAIIIIFRSVPSLHAFGTTLLTGAGILAAIVGFASQQAFSNIISGIFLVIFKPFSVGDRVRIGTLYTGDVEDITLRHVVIKDFENRRIVIPNSVISNETIVNSTITDEKVCMFVEFNISFESSIDLAMKIMQETTSAHTLCIDNRTEEEKEKGEPKVQMRVIEITDFSVKIRAYAWARSPSEGFDLKCDLIKQIKERFDKENVEIPYPHRTILHRDQVPAVD
ncbi:MAG TPA: mechanosensitive ion channel family protein [Cyclobacteriaceae bacterium]|nr:mechanosensitive ion channel family protein [Cyclobacteriaceae bacterium]